MPMLARLKPFAPKRGHVLRSYTVLGNRFLVERRWYPVDDGMAATLRGIKQQSTEPDGPDAFDVVTQAEAEAIDAREASDHTKGATPAASLSNVTPMRAHRASVTGTLTTADLPSASPPKASSSFDAEPANFSDDMSDTEALPEEPAALDGGEDSLPKTAPTRATRSRR